MKLYELCYEWLDIYHKSNIKRQTYVKYVCIIENYIKPNIDNKNIKSINSRDIQLFINKLKTIKGIRTNKLLSIEIINETITILKLVFAYAMDFELIHSNPTLKIKYLKKQSNNIVKCFTIEEQRKIEQYCYNKNNILYFSIIFDLYTGLRIGELLALTWDGVNIKEGLITINKTCYITKDNNNIWKEIIDTPKTKTSYRDIYLTDNILKQLLKYKHNNNQIFTLDDGKHINSKLLRYHYNNMLKELNIKHISFHSLRHTFATRALELGIDVKTVADIMGHKDARITLNTYAHSLNDQKKNAVKILNNFINNSR